MSKIDIIIGNPPYVSTKETGDSYKPFLQSTFGFSDDLYSHFFFKALQNHQDFGTHSPALLRNGGILCFITSKTYFTIQTKNNLRQLLLSKKILEINDVGNPFYKSAMVDTAICILENTDTVEKNTNLSFDQSQNVKYQEYSLMYKNSQIKNQKHSLDFENVAQTYTISNQIYTNAINQVIFEPNTVNLKIYDKYNQKVAELMNKWWDKISTSKNITKHQTELEKYRQELKAGDVTLLGLVTDGGSGISVGKTNEFIAEIDYENDFDSESNYRGMRFVTKKISHKNIVDYNHLSEEEKVEGVIGPNTWIGFEKGNGKNFMWYKPVDFAINWSKEAVKFYFENSGKKGQNMPVVRNPRFYFEKGFSISKTSGETIFARLVEPTVFNTEAPKFISLSKKLTEKYLICLLNSTFSSNYLNSFCNNTVHFSENDVRKLPIIVPTDQQLADFEDLFDRAYQIKLDQFDRKISENQAKKQLDKIQEELDEMVKRLYNV